MEIKKFNELNGLPYKYCIKINNRDELNLVLELYTINNIKWYNGDRANAYIPNRDYPFYINYNYFNENEITHGGDLVIKEISIDEFKNIKKRKRKINRDIDPYDEEDWGWVDDD